MNFVVTVHAFERVEERFPDWIEGKDDVEQAHMMHEEVMDALDAGRHGAVPPLTLGTDTYDQSFARRHRSYFAWTPDRKRAYILLEHSEDLVVLTVVAAVSYEHARRRLQRRYVYPTADGHKII